MIEVQSVSRVFRKGGREVKALDNVTFSIATGECVLLKGPSGSGKTTLLLALGGMRRPTEGTVSILGQDLYAMGARERATFRARHIGFVFQMFHLIPYLSVLENVLLAKASRGLQDRRREACDWLEEIGLSDRLSHRPGELSVGERQRVALVRAVLERPDLVLADEPTGNLDADNAALVLRGLSRYRDEGGTVVMVTHGDKGPERNDRTFCLERGQLLSETTDRAAGTGSSGIGT